MYNLCRKFKKLPNEIEGMDSYWVDVFEVIIDQEGRELKKEQDKLRANSLAAMGK